ncbi:MAG: LysR substrate-binding domain-containing protein [Bacteroidia bacterium]|nr:LysR substrate-binding domain-containing protein [Bacteroidia bacterium]
MNIQQFQYLLALAETKHFERAAEACHITQSTLSTMISKFEDELGILVFDRKKKPIEMSAEGEVILEQIKKIKKEIDSLNDLTQEIKGEVKGHLSVSVIPTIAPYILPNILRSFSQKFPKLELVVKEQTTEEIIRLLKARQLDIGILSTPLNDKEIIEHHLYDEPFVFYSETKNDKSTISTNQIETKNLCLLEEGHCMRAQVLELCSQTLKKKNTLENFKYNAGSIDSLMKFVSTNKMDTLLPYLASEELSAKEKKKIIYFKEPVPYRSIGIVVHKHFVRKKILTLLKEEIIQKIAPQVMPINQKGLQLQPI